MHDIENNSCLWSQITTDINGKPLSRPADSELNPGCY